MRYRLPGNLRAKRNEGGCVSDKIEYREGDNVKYVFIPFHILYMMKIRYRQQQGCACIICIAFISLFLLFLN